jgi:hypothetical protein
MCSRATLKVRRQADSGFSRTIMALFGDIRLSRHAPDWLAFVSAAGARHDWPSHC